MSESNEDILLFNMTFVCWTTVPETRGDESENQRVMIQVKMPIVIITDVNDRLSNYLIMIFMIFYF